MTQYECVFWIFPLPFHYSQLEETILIPFLNACLDIFNVYVSQFYISTIYSQSGGEISVKSLLQQVFLCLYELFNHQGPLSAPFAYIFCYYFKLGQVQNFTKNIQNSTKNVVLQIVSLDHRPFIMDYFVIKHPIVASTPYLLSK